MQVQIVAFPWYRQADFQRLRALFTDSHLLHETYDEWLQAAGVLQQRMEQQGLRVIRVDLDPDAFQGWCQQHGRSADAKARMDFASSLMQASFSKSGTSKH
jgi:hypothetical protein